MVTGCTSFTPQGFVSFVTRTLAAGFLQADKHTPINIIHVYVHSHTCCSCLICANWKRKFSFRNKPSKPERLIVRQTWACIFWKLLQKSEARLLILRKGCISLLLWYLERLAPVTLCIISRDINYWSWMAEAYYFPTALICWGARWDTSHP